jgi:phosphatidylglycerol:prolipoprotein diacylglycerol transferase
MARKSPARRHPAPALLPPALARKHAAEEATQSGAVVQSTLPPAKARGFSALLEHAAQEALAVTYWFEPASHPEPYPLTVRFSGKRVNGQGRIQPGDQFVQDETIEHAVPGSGPISLTAKVRSITPGEWVVAARLLESPRHTRAPREPGKTTPAGGTRLGMARVWRRWAPSTESSDPVRTRLPPFAKAPGVIPGMWSALVTLGMVIALALQFLVVAVAHLHVGSAQAITLVSIAVGIIGAKGWFIVLHRRARGLDRIAGWCIQGFLTGAVLAALLLLVLLHVPVGVFLDATAPGLLVAMGIGRVDCFLAGCCGGPPTASGFGVWSSDQRVGARRTPTQLLESALALSLGLLALVAVLAHGPAGGAFFMGGLAAYTLGRQGILRLRAEPRKTRLGGLVVATLAALVLVAATVSLAL